MKLYQCKEWQCSCGSLYFRSEDIANRMTCLNSNCSRYESTICDGCESDVTNSQNHYC